MRSRTEASTTVYVYDAFGKLAAEYGPASGSTQAQAISPWTISDPRDWRRTRPASRSNAATILPFGEEIPAGSGGRSSCFAASDNKIKFAGKERDAPTGLDFSLARYYSASQGRFTSDDPLNIPALQQSNPKQFAAIIANPQNWNGYAYAHNNPLKKVDPDGFLTILVAGTWNNPQRLEEPTLRAGGRFVWRDGCVIAQQ